MKPAYITCIKDESDLIYFNLVYYYNLGIRDFYIMFNNSDEATQNEVRQFVQNFTDIFFQFDTDTDPAYRQPERMKKLSDAAHKNGCDWIVPIDADEILKIKGYKTIQEYLSNFDHHEFGYINMKWIDYQETEKDNSIDENIFSRWRYRNKKPRGPSKIIVKWHPDMRYGDGHHLIVSKRKLIAETKIAIMAHFPNRSRDQLLKKMKTIGAAFIPVFGEDSKRPQVVRYHEIMRDGDIVVDRIWKKIQEYRENEFVNFVYDPIDINYWR